MHRAASAALACLLLVVPLQKLRSQPAAVPPVPGGRTTQQVVPRLEFPNADVISVLQFYEGLTGKKLVYDNTVQGQVNIVIRQPLTEAQAIEIIETNLTLNGFSLVPMEGESDIVKVIGTSKNPRIAGVPIYTTNEALPRGDRVVSLLYTLQHAAPEEVAQTLSAYIAPQAWTVVVPLPKSNSILITENTSVLRGLKTIIAKMDVEPANVVSEFISLQRADAEDVIEKLRAMFEPDAGQGQTRTASSPARNTPQAPPVPGQPPQPGGQSPPTVEITGGTGLSEDSLIEGKIILTADVRTNRIHVVTRPKNMPFVRDLIAEFDSEVEFGHPTARPLRYVSAGDILDVIVQAIAEKGSDDQTTPTGAGAGQGQAGGGGGGQGTINLGGGGGGSGAGGLSISEGLSTEPKDITPLAVTVGNAKIIADRRSNAIIVLGNNDVKEKIFKVIDEMDVRAPQVLLRTVIGEMSLGKDFELGFDYLYRSENSTQTTTTGTDGMQVVTDNPVQLGRAFAGISRTTLAPLLDAAAIGSAAAFGTPLTGLTAYLAPIDELQIIVRALEASDRFRVTSRPSVFTSNNKKAIIVSGQEIAVPVSSVSAFTSGTDFPSVSSSIQYKPIALQLEVVPLINADGDVSLDILQKVDSVSGSTIIDGNSIPTVSTRYIRTSVSVPDRGVVVLGGLIKEDEMESTAGIPYLSRIPLLGRLFRTDTKNKVRSELIVLLSPEVTNNIEHTERLRQDEEEILHMEPDLESTLYPEGRRPVLPGSEMLRAPEMPVRSK